MDTSETFIKMCEKAWEIQNLRIVNDRFQQGDYLCNSLRAWTVADGAIYRCWGDIWLPTQDQLQEMLREYTKQSPIQLAAMFGERMYDQLFNYKERIHYYSHEMSMEQLWLCFMMKERYSTIWNGEDWIKS